MERKCKNCGCADVETDFSFGGSLCVVCNHCGERTVIGFGLEQVEFQFTPCPHCEGRSKITETNRRKDGTYRVHQCLGKCGNRFSSMDREQETVR